MGFVSALMLCLGLALSFSLVRRFSDTLSLEKALLYTGVVYITLVGVVGFIFNQLGVLITPFNFLMTFLFMLILIPFENQAKITFSKTTILFLIAFLFFTAYFLYPSLPKFNGACYLGFDCSLHEDYVTAIHETGKLLPPIFDWKYYPSELHINAALVSPYYLWGFMSLVMAGIYTALGLLIFEVTRKRRYVIVFWLLLLVSLLPISMSVEYGFFTQTLAVFIMSAGFLALNDYYHRQSEGSLFMVLVTAVSILLCYQILMAGFLVLPFIIILLLKRKQLVEHGVSYFGVFLIAYLIITVANYNRYLTPDTQELFGDRVLLKPVGYTLSEFLAQGSKQVMTDGAAIYANITQYGLIMLFLMMVFLVFARKDGVWAVGVGGVLAFLMYYAAERLHMISTYYLAKTNYSTYFVVAVMAVLGLYHLFNGKTKVLFIAGLLVFTLAATYTDTARHDTVWTMTQDVDLPVYLFGKRDRIYKTDHDLRGGHNAWGIYDFNRMQKQQNSFYADIQVHIPDTPLDVLRAWYCKVEWRPRAELWRKNVSLTRYYCV